MTDNLNSQPLIPGMGFQQTTFGLGSDDGDVLDVPPVFIADVEVIDGPDIGRAQAVASPKIGSALVVAPILVDSIPKPTAGTIMRPTPKIGSIKIVPKK